ncbi:hypothetical protein CIHG_02881 [Coccidioides immitis H538.4]|uniref:Uncharacterized protein n=3 Tax=Coccidioides immitis TaxID=5501 RepID=A0A0J8R5R7_COCIT|nr:hypothetical protein CIRG_07593 [Coccidioides immitis RMSCC 2394]KMU79053.1 hypothetical protein CISG_07360 [Coccidioides immitis RMSCC 3703]KMU85099.1 hypothetical protein CIHG_02881 [Coccidioides immitis H538.4]TPX19695.1 hypothetical protein DIZ76_017487 [Coccidioides immitis]
MTPELHSQDLTGALTLERVPGSSLTSDIPTPLQQPDVHMRVFASVVFNIAYGYLHYTIAMMRIPSPDSQSRVALKFGRDVIIEGLEEAPRRAVSRDRSGQGGSGRVHQSSSSLADFISETNLSPPPPTVELQPPT